MSALWLWQGTVVVAFVALLLLIALTNLWFLRRLGTYRVPSELPRVSILVPARNEEANIVPCLHSLLEQQYPDFELVVLDDESTDCTGALVADLARSDSRLRLLEGLPAPPGWLGKHWACHQLAEVAGGELLLFTDADTRHDPRALATAVAALAAEEADLLSAIPHQETVSWSERLVIPVLPWCILAFLPLGIAHRLRAPSLAAAIGQYMLFRRAAYEKVGGHGAVRQDVVDDIALARRIKAHGLRWRLADAGPLVRCRMYSSWGELRDGFGKNLWAAFGHRLGLYAFVGLWLGFAFWGPLIALALLAAGVGMPAFTAPQAIAAVVLSLALWSVPHLRFRFPLYLIPLYPVSILLVLILAARSLRVTLAARAAWKGRLVPKPPRRPRR